MMVLKVVLVVALIVLAVLLPLLHIWALNTLFPALAIPYGIETYFAMFLVNGMILYRGGHSN
jgi:hypothetical protein